MYSGYYQIHPKKLPLHETPIKDQLKEPLMNPRQPKQELVSSIKNEAERLADRALLLLSFKNTSSQNLHHVLKVLGIHSVDEKKRILQEIFRLIREGIVYVPHGLPLLVDQGLENIENMSAINLVLLRPYDQLITELQEDISLFKD
jgi:hypothetical protein